MKKIFKESLQIALGVTLCYTGFLHLTSRRAEFQAQVPSWLPLDADFVVLASGIVEIVLGLSLLFLWPWKTKVGLLQQSSSFLFFQAMFGSM